MYTTHTYQDWANAPEADRPALLADIIKNYKASPEFQQAKTANLYFRAENPETAKKMLLRPKTISVTEKIDGDRTRTRKRNRMEKIDGNRVYSDFFRRFVIQQNQFLLGNGVTLDNEETKRRLGPGFDKRLESMGEKALKHGVCWGFWNVDRLEIIEAAADAFSGFVALLDERTSVPMVGVQFWQIGPKRPMYVRLFELDGVTVYRETDNGMQVIEPKRAYKLTTMTDAIGTEVIAADNYGALPVLPLYASEEKRSELTPAIKSKIDLYDRILSDFGDNLDRACDVYWVLNNFGGTMDEIAETLAAIEQIKAVANISDGTTNSSTAEPHTIEVPYAARQSALEILQKQLYNDFMALSMDDVTGGSLTNVAIETAMTNINLKADRYEWQCYQFVQRLLSLLGIQTEEIKFKRQTLVNRSEIVADIAVMRDYIDQETALKLNPYIDQEEIKEITERLAAESVAAAPMPETEVV